MVLAVAFEIRLGMDPKRLLWHIEFVRQPRLQSSQRYTVSAACIGLCVGAVVGCADPTLFCNEHSECLNVAADAQCEANHRCSIPDTDCESGRRYEQRAGRKIQGTCVDLDEIGASESTTADSAGMDGSETGEPGTSGISESGSSGSGDITDSSGLAEMSGSEEGASTSDSTGGSAGDTGTGGMIGEPGVAYRYFEGNYELLPDFDTLTPTMEGVAPNFDIGVAVAADYFALEFTGYIDVAMDGMYTFYLQSDDGSRLSINDMLMVDNDGLHGAMMEIPGQVMLTAGKHPIVVTFFEAMGDESLVVSYEGPGIAKVPIPDAVLTHDP